MSLSSELKRLLLTTNADDKAVATRSVVAAWRSNELSEFGGDTPPDRPALPNGLHLTPPNQMPRRKASGSVKNRATLLHALAHIERTAIDLALDMVLRFAQPNMPPDFIYDWLAVSDDEARHFLMIN